MLLSNKCEQLRHNDTNKPPIRERQKLSNPVRQQHYFQYGGYCGVERYDRATLVRLVWMKKNLIAEAARAYQILYDKRRVDVRLASS